ncbi:uncharacterized protein [Procambarus clarkii]|uniref:uncharacterized protein n=1 Tax=Procambarus clarkii TaxID=6728 RepID=UPI0037433008
MVEVLIIKIEILNVVIVLVYKSPEANPQQFKDQLMKIEHCLENLTNPAPNIILLGDFNLRHLKWEHLANTVISERIPGSSLNEQAHANDLLRMCDRFALNQQIEPTRKENTLDLIFTNNDELIRNIMITNTCYSDHNLIEVMTTMGNRPSKPVQIPGGGDFGKFNFNNKQINWEQINKDFTEINWEEQLENANLNQCLENISSVALKICSNRIPLRKRRKRCRLERERRSLYRRRKRITEQRSRTLSQERRKRLGREIETIELKLQESYKTQERQREQKAVSEIEKNQKYFFSYAKSRLKTTSSIGPLRKGDGTFTDDNKEMSELLRKQYDSVFSKPLNALKIDNPNEFFMDMIPTSNHISDVTLSHCILKKP